MDELNIEILAELLRQQGYIASEGLVNAAFAAIKLRRPLLLDGPAGVGKTELAKSLAAALSANLVRLQCYKGITISHVLYDIDHAKINSYSTLLEEKIKKIVDGLTWEEAVHKLEVSHFFGMDDFLIKRPVLRALSPDSKQTQLLLIDEIDKASEQIEALLLEALGEFSISIPELGKTIVCANKPIIIITSNNYRELGEPFMRRCIYAYIDFPDLAQEMKIIKTKANVSDVLAYSIAVFIQFVRKNVSFKKLPSISESIDFAKVLGDNLNVLYFNDSYKSQIKKGLCTLAKRKEDVIALEEYFEKECSRIFECIKEKTSSMI